MVKGDSRNSSGRAPTTGTTASGSARGAVASALSAARSGHGKARCRDHVCGDVPKVVAELYFNQTGFRSSPRY